MAYRTADHERWQNLDFVVGIEIHLSGNHTCKGRDGKPHRFTDICDQLKGKYPKDFKFTGWHPHCRCYATSILKTEEEMDADMDRIMAGEDLSGESVNKVAEPPKGFKDWVEKNEKRIAEARENGTLPYFIKDNIHDFANASEETATSRNSHKGQYGHKPTKHGEQFLSVPMERLKPDKEVVEHTTKQAQKIQAKMGKPMKYEDADQGNPNMYGDNDNCQSSAVAFYARLLGMDVTSKKYKDGGDFVKELENDQTLAYWKSPKERVHPKSSRKLMNVQEVLDYVEKETAKNGIYNISLNKFKNKKDGHVICLIKVNGEAYFVDVQKGINVDFSEQLSHVDFVVDEDEKKKKGVEFLRVDKCVLSDDALKVLKAN